MSNTNQRLTGEYSLGNNIKEALRLSGKKQTELSEFCKVDKSHVCKWCNNIHHPSAHYLQMIADFTGFSYEQILTGNLRSKNYSSKSNSKPTNAINAYAENEVDSIMNFVEMIIENQVSIDDPKMSVLRTKVESLARITG